MLFQTTVWKPAGCTVDVGLHEDLPHGRRVHAEKATLLSGFLFLFVKEKGYTQGTKVNKRPCSRAAINSLPFFIWTEIKANGNQLILHSSAHLVTDKHLAWSLPLPFPMTTLGALHEELIPF